MKIDSLKFVKSSDTHVGPTMVGAEGYKIFSFKVFRLSENGFLIIKNLLGNTFKFPCFLAKIIVVHEQKTTDSISIQSLETEQEINESFE